MNVITPPAFVVTVPLGTVIVCGVPGVKTTPLIEVTTNVSPSGSVSSVNGTKVTGVSSAVVYVSSTATGASFTGVMLIISLAVSVPPFPSEIVYGKLTVPL